jgi:hypothetical protein
LFKNLELKLYVGLFCNERKATETATAIRTAKKTTKVL